MHHTKMPVGVLFWLEKRLVEKLKQIEIVVEDSCESIGILYKMEGENMMEKHLKVFRAHSLIFSWSEVIELLKSLHHGCEIITHQR